MTREALSDDTTIEQTLGRAARASVLLVASDFDGTISEIVPNPGDARPLPGAIESLVSLAGMVRTHVAVVSGRALEELRDLAGLPASVHMIGSHGSEMSDDPSPTLTPEQQALRAHVEAGLAEIAARHPGCTIEGKPASVALHYRNAPELDEDALRRGVLEDGPGALGGVHSKLGKKVIELTVVETDKGTAVDSLRGRLGADAVVFFGDDVTDEDVFARLGADDVGIKVGIGASVAAMRVSEPADAVRWLEWLVWARGESSAASM